NRDHTPVRADCLRRLSAATAPALSHHVGMGLPDVVFASGDMRYPLSGGRRGTYSGNTKHHTVEASISMGNTCVSADFSTPGMGSEKRAIAYPVFWLGAGIDQSHRNRPQVWE